MKKVISFGISEITLCDTIGTANPKQVSILLDRVKPITENIRLGLHFHDTRGMGLANTLSGLLKV